MSRIHLTTLRAVDPIPSRRNLAQLVGASEALDPSNFATLGEDAKVDTSIEVSGVAAGLQTALDYTGYGGRVVIGSWYANHEKPAALKFGLAFHRSHLRILVSQVKSRKFVYPCVVPETWQLTEKFLVFFFLYDAGEPDIYGVTGQVDKSAQVS